MNKVFEENGEWFFRCGPFLTENVATNRLAEHTVETEPETQRIVTPEKVCRECAYKKSSKIWEALICRGTCDSCGKVNIPLWG